MHKTMFAALSAVALIAAPVFAQQANESDTRPQPGQTQVERDQPAQSTQQTQNRQQRTGQAQTGQPRPGQQRGAAGRQSSERGPAMRASDITGMNVRNQQNEDLGKLDDIVIDLQSGQIRYAALSVGGLLGIGDSLYAVPWNAFRLRAVDGDYHLVLNASSQQFENAPGFKKDNWPDMADPQWRTTNDKFYVEGGISTAAREGDRTRGTTGARQDGERIRTERQPTDRQNGARVEGDRPEGTNQGSNPVRPQADNPQRDN